MISSRLRYLWLLSSGQRGRILLSCFSGTCSVGFSLGFIWASKKVIDIATGDASGNLLVSGIVVVLLMVMQLLCDALDTWLENRMQVDSANSLRHRLFACLLRSRWNELEQFHSGDVVNRIEQDTTTIVTLFTGSIPSLVVTVLQLLAAFLFFFYLDASLPWFLVGCMPVLAVAGRFYSKRMQVFSRNIRKSDSRIQAIIQESLQHRMVIKTLEQTERNIEQVKDMQHLLRNQVSSRTRFSIISRLLVASMFSGGYLVAFLWGAVRLSTGSITFGTMSAFLQLVGKVQRPVFDLSRLLPTFVNALTAVERLMELETLPSEDKKMEKLLFASTPSVRLSNVSFAYNEGERPVFTRLNMVFPSGSRTAVLGETGAGKTTLIRLLLALTQPQEGKIWLEDEQQCVSVSPCTRCNFIYVPQGNTLFSGTIRENLLMGNPDATDEEMEQTLHIAVADFVNELPQGIDTVLNEQGGRLSEGQAQRIAIARALLRPGNILLLDEATSALDPETEKCLLDNLKQDCSGKTCIFITHHAALAQECDRSWNLSAK